MLRELCAAILPSPGLARALAGWNEIAKRLAESKRNHKRQVLK
jgi:hypothetical protein